MTRSMTPINRRATAVGRILLAVAAPVLLFSAPARAQTDATVAVHAGYLAMAGRGYDDLDQLEAAVRAGRPVSVQIAWCDDASARAWLGVVARFGELPLRFEPAGAPCGAVPLPVSAAAGGSPRGIDDAAVADYWNRRMP